MKHFQRLNVLLIWLLTMPVFAEKSAYLPSDNSVLPALYNLEKQDNLILVAFKDSGINRKRPPGQYMMRGSYQSTTWSKRIGLAIAEDYGLKELAAWPVTELDMHCIVYQLPEALLIQPVLQKLSQDQRLHLVQKMRFYHTKVHAYSDPYYKLQSQVQLMNLEELHTYATGKDITIALIDTGVDLDHPDLLGQVSENHNYASKVSPDFINDLHGTAVAGVMVAHANNGTGIVGIAPDAKLLALKSCWPINNGKLEAICNSFTIALAINKAIKSKADILNLSLSGNHDPLLHQLVNKAMSEGMIVVAATDESNESDNFPASIPRVLGVRSTSSEPGKNINEQTISAPGDEILTTFPKASYDFVSGSSLSAAHISGIVALLLERNPELNAGQITKLLKTHKTSDLYHYFSSDNNKIAYKYRLRTHISGVLSDIESTL